MRNRTEMVTNTGSDYDEEAGEFEADDGSDDWKPDPEVIIFVRNVQTVLYMYWYKWRHFKNSKYQRETTFLIKIMNIFL